MAIDDEVKKLVQAQLQQALKPFQVAMQRLADAANDFAGMATGGEAPASSAGKRRGRPPGRPARAGKAASGGAQGGTGAGSCGIKGCPRPARSKGYCSAHYQKRRNLEKSKRLPADWKDNPAPQSLEDLKLPRGRAASKKAQG